MGMAPGVYMSENQHIYEDLNESSSARLGGSQQQEIPPSLNSKAAWFSAGANILDTRQYFGHPPIFWTLAKILGIRQNFRHPPEFSWDARILSIRQNFHETPEF